MTSPLAATVCLIDDAGTQPRRRRFQIYRMYTKTGPQFTLRPPFLYRQKIGRNKFPAS
jgi:hypothetical protein